MSISPSTVLPGQTLFFLKGFGKSFDVKPNEPEKLQEGADVKAMRDLAEDNSIDDDFIAIRIQNLRKEFKDASNETLVAVRNLSMVMRKGGYTVIFLLFHSLFLVIKHLYLCVRLVVVVFRCLLWDAGI